MSASHKASAAKLAKSMVFAINCYNIVSGLRTTTKPYYQGYIVFSSIIIGDAAFATITKGNICHYGDAMIGHCFSLDSAVL